MSDRDDFGAFLVGFVIGGVAGAITALLFAPQSGEETRTLIKDKTIELHDKASETVEQTLAKAEAAASEAVKKADQLLKDAQKKAAEVAEKGQVVLEQQKEKLAKTTKDSKSTS